MIKTIIQLAVVLVLFLLVYNYFMGTGEEKQNAKEIFREMKDVGVAVKDLLKSEKEKFDSGKYDNAIEKMRLLISNLESLELSSDLGNRRPGSSAGIRRPDPKPGGKTQRPRRTTRPGQKHYGSGRRTSRKGKGTQPGHGSAHAGDRADHGRDQTKKRARLNPKVLPECTP